jgi:hypothetical protein
MPVIHRKFMPVNLNLFLVDGLVIALALDHWGASAFLRGVAWTLYGILAVAVIAAVIMEDPRTPRLDDK